jgi:hypothetical protein
MRGTAFCQPDSGSFSNWLGTIAFVAGWQGLADLFEPKVSMTVDRYAESHAASL